MPGTLQDREPADVVDYRMEEMRNIISSQSFAKAPRLCSFLTYIVERSVDGDVDSLTEQQIGIHVFQRQAGYNSNDDNIVRGTARSLRQRLATYYLTEGARNSIRIEIPKGAYVAQFHDASVPKEFSAAIDVFSPPSTNSELVATAPPSPAKPYRQIWLAWGTAAIFAAIACWSPLHNHWVRSRDKSNLLWNTLFTRDRPTIIVPGDAGLNMYEGLEKRTVDLHDYSQQNYSSEPAPSGTSLGNMLGARFYTTFSDMQLTSRLVRLPQADPERTQVRFARDLSATEIKDANLILMGTRSYDPWTELFQSGLSFKMSWDINQDLFTITNVKPRPGEQLIYQWTVKRGTQGGLTLISLTDNSQGSGRVLLVEGTTMAGVYAGADFLSNKQMLEPILLQAKRSDGTLRNFDVLVQSDFMREGVSNLRVLAIHIN